MEETVIIRTEEFIWLLLSGIDAFKRDNDRLNSANEPLTAKSESKKAPSQTNVFGGPPLL